MIGLASHLRVRVITTKDLIISALKLCLLYRAKDRAIDSRFTRNTVPQPVQRIITLFLNPGRKGDGQADNKQLLKHVCLFQIRFFYWFLFRNSQPQNELLNNVQNGVGCKMMKFLLKL